MKYYGITKKIRTEKALYELERFRIFCSQYVAIDRRKRGHFEYLYKHRYLAPHQWLHSDLAIPQGKYYTPICIITSDLILREDVRRLQQGLTKMLEKQHSHKFIGGQPALDEIEHIIGKMDDILVEWHDKYRIGTFDFERSSLMKKMITYFDVRVKNHNSSYLEIEFCLYLADDYRNDLIQIINSDYVNEKGYVAQGFVRTYGASGGKKAYGIRYYNGAHLKSDLIYERICKLKWLFYERIQRYFPTVLHQNGVIPPSVNIFRTNIGRGESLADEFWNSVGVRGRNGQSLDDSSKIFFSTDLSGRYEDTTATDLIYVVNALTMTRNPIYYSIDFQIVQEFLDGVGADVFAFAVLRALNGLVANKLIFYKMRLNKVKLRRNGLSRLLKLRYQYERDIDFYTRFVRDGDWKAAQHRVAMAFGGKRQRYSSDYRAITEWPLIPKAKIVEQIGVLRSEFAEKILILQHLREYKIEKGNWLINYIMLVLTISTVLFIIFPNLSEGVASWLSSAWEFVKNLFVDK